MTQRPIVLTRRVRQCRKKDTVQYAGRRLRHGHAASEFGGLGTLLCGQRQIRAVDEEGVIEEWVSDSSARHNRCDRGRTKSLIKLKEAR
jgi:hypothetical protein